MKGNVMIVDDDRDTLRVLGMGLERSGYTVYPASNWDEIEDLIKENKHKFQPFDVIILDLMMPVHSGFDTFKMLKEVLIGIPPVVMLTAKNSMDAALEASDLGIKKFVTKPVSIKHLVGVLEELIAG